MRSTRRDVHRIDLIPYFTDREDLIALFDSMMSEEDADRRLLVLWGVSGVGKSTLLTALCQRCLDQNVVFARVSGDSHTSVRSTLEAYCTELAPQDVHLTRTAALLERLTSMDRRIAKAARESALFPVPGDVVDWAAEKLADSLIRLVSELLARPDYELWEDPDPLLTKAFLEDMDECSRERIVLFCDAYEKVASLGTWWPEVARDLPNEVLLVVSGQSPPDWRSTWESWRAHAKVAFVGDIEEAAVRELIRRQSKSLGMEIAADAADELVRFAQGLPIAITSALDLLLDRHEMSIRDVEIESVDVIVDKLMTGMPDDLTSVIEAAASLRWFNQELLQVLLPDADIQAVYDQLLGYRSFVRSVGGAYAVHDCYRLRLNDWLRLHAPQRYHDLHSRAAAYFDRTAVDAGIYEENVATVEALYHTMCCDESDGLGRFQAACEQMVMTGRLSRLDELVNASLQFPFDHPKSLAWRHFYQGELLRLRDQLEDGEEILNQVVETARSINEPRLLGYALGSLGETWRRRCYISKFEDLGLARDALLESTQILGGMGYKGPRYLRALLALADPYFHLDEPENARGWEQRAIRLAEECNDDIAVATVYSSAIHFRGMRDNFAAVEDARQRVLECCRRRNLHEMALRIGASWSIGAIWMGHYRRAENVLRDLLNAPDIMSAEDQRSMVSDLAYTLGMQMRHDEADQLLDEWAPKWSHLRLGRQRIVQGYRGHLAIRRGYAGETKQLLIETLKQKRELGHTLGTPELLYWLGLAAECDGVDEKAARYYSEAHTIGANRRNYFDCGALTGLVRVRYRMGDAASLPDLFRQAEELAQRFEYNDHLASLELSRAQLAWENMPGNWGMGTDAALEHLQRALIFALRYNRFMLDEMLWGGSICTPLRPIVPYCEERWEEDGAKVLSGLLGWWRTGTNTVGADRLNTLSPLPQRIPLIDAERIARKEEPGDESEQISVEEALSRVLS